MLVREELIIEVHDDFDPWADVVVGFDDDKCLNVIFEYESYNEERKYNLRAIVSFDDARELANKLSISLLDLPREFQRRLGEDSHFASVSECRETFQAILNFIDAYRIDYRVKREARDKRID